MTTAEAWKQFEALAERLAAEDVENMLSIATSAAEDYAADQDEEAQEPGSDAAVKRGCICTARMVRATDTEPPEVTVARYCPLHGIDPDYERDRMIDDKLTGDA